MGWPSQYDIVNIAKRDPGEVYEGREFIAAVHHHGRPFGPWDKGRQLPYAFDADRIYCSPSVRREFLDARSLKIRDMARIRK